MNSTNKTLLFDCFLIMYNLCFHSCYLHFCISLYTCANVICIKLLLTYLLTYLLTSTLHCSPTLRTLNCSVCLLFSASITKIVMMTFNCVHGTCPAYFRDVCRPEASVGARARLRSAHRSDLVEYRTKSKRYGTPRSFCISAAAVWNKLPSQRLRT